METLVTVVIIGMVLLVLYSRVWLGGFMRDRHPRQDRAPQCLRHHLPGVTRNRG
jgi:hypothetical protein